MLWLRLTLDFHRRAHISTEVEPARPTIEESASGRCVGTHGRCVETWVLNGVLAMGAVWAWVGRQVTLLLLYCLNGVVSVWC